MSNNFLTKRTGERAVCFDMPCVKGYGKFSGSHFGMAFELQKHPSDALTFFMAHNIALT